MSALELRSVTCCVRSSGGAPRLNFGVFYAGFGHVFRRFGLFLALVPEGDPKGWQHKSRSRRFLLTPIPWRPQEVAGTPAGPR